jgi:hypothetical protein
MQLISIYYLQLNVVECILSTWNRDIACRRAYAGGIREMENKVIEILNKDERACRMMKKFEDAAAETGVTGKEYEEDREAMLMMLISWNPEAMAAMASKVYHEINGEG